jgi:hypothetical protein
MQTKVAQPLYYLVVTNRLDRTMSSRILDAYPTLGKYRDFPDQLSNRLDDLATSLCR